MRLLFLRGRVPTDRPKEQIMYDDLQSNCDMWTQLACALNNDYGEVWYWGGKRSVEYFDNFIERWIPNFKNYKPKFVPDIIFCRGGFSEYDYILNKFPSAFKIYYGAGKRFYPQAGKFRNYNLILNDTPAQVFQSAKKFPNIACRLFIKPAADNIFYPHEGNKNYDVIFVGNKHPRGIKGHSFILNNTPKDMSLLQIGILDKAMAKKFGHVKFKGWIPRKKIPQYYAESKVSIVCVDDTDSCPRVIPESLACGCPLLILDSVNFWKEKYIVDGKNKTGMICNKNNFVNALKYMVDNHKDFLPYNYYKSNLSVEVAANHIRNLIDEQ